MDLLLYLRYSSFAPQRRAAAVKWYVDGKDYFSDVADVIMSATEEIFITDWWLSPEIFLKRSQSTMSVNRLDQLLKLKVSSFVQHNEVTMHQIFSNRKLVLCVLSFA